MRTKFVYVSVSRDSDFFLEMTWVSVWSLKYHNPEAQVYFVADNETIDNIKKSYRKDFLKLVDNIVQVSLPDSLTEMEKSRWLKTKLRSLIVGDFLYLDSDIVVTDNLDEIDDFECQMGMVLNWQVKLSEGLDDVKPLLKKVYNYEGGVNENYFNGGVIFCKDTPETHKLFEDWHNNWLISKSKGWSFDQLALYKAQLDNPSVTTEIDGIYNCQITVSLKSFLKAKIVHFYSANNTTFTPFKRKDTYMKIKESLGLSDELKDMIIHCKECFYGPILIQEKDMILLSRQPAYSFLYIICNNFPLLFKGLNLISEALLKLIKLAKAK